LNKAVYLFSADPSGEKVTHANFIPKAVVSKEFDARVWATKISGILGGKVCPPLVVSAAADHACREEARTTLPKASGPMPKRLQRPSGLQKRHMLRPSERLLDCSL
jgi:hypothetical protein